MKHKDLIKILTLATTICLSSVCCEEKDNNVADIIDAGSDLVKIHSDDAVSDAHSDSMSDSMSDASSDSSSDVEIVDATTDSNSDSCSDAGSDQ